MIQLTRLNGKTFSLNALYIESVESFPDTTITLTNSRKYIVVESEEVVVSKIAKFYQSIQVLSNPHIRGDDDEKQ
ncbi:flagellar FlbD family protein [Ureibacillus chungkukjangi]|uniref:flagellar FlbD family protein n=1 Tax=Ureibacillus chungkukjangi TaxID=1202712 RepID=UPI000D33DB80|nr:flagellar FlbD family protein [Ureibacillus chungkukjangi]